MNSVGESSQRPKSSAGNVMRPTSDDASLRRAIDELRALAERLSSLDKEAEIQASNVYRDVVTAYRQTKPDQAFPLWLDANAPAAVLDRVLEAKFKRHFDGLKSFIRKAISEIVETWGRSVWFFYCRFGPRIASSRDCVERIRNLVNNRRDLSVDAIYNEILDARAERLGPERYTVLFDVEQDAVVVFRPMDIKTAIGRLSDDTFQSEYGAGISRAASYVNGGRLSADIPDDPMQSDGSGSDMEVVASQNNTPVESLPQEERSAPHKRRRVNSTHNPSRPSTPRPVDAIPPASSPFSLEGGRSIIDCDTTFGDALRPGTPSAVPQDRWEHVAARHPDGNSLDISELGPPEIVESPHAATFQTDPDTPAAPVPKHQVSQVASQVSSKHALGQGRVPYDNLENLEDVIRPEDRARFFGRSTAGWFNDAIMNLVAEMLVTVDSRAHTLSSGLLGRPVNSSNIKDRFLNEDAIIFLTANIDGNHWVLLEVDVQLKTVSVFDSSSPSVLQPCADTIARHFVSTWLPPTRNKPDDWTFVATICPHQPNTTDCGPFALGCLCYRISGLKVPDRFNASVLRAFFSVLCSDDNASLWESLPHDVKSRPEPRGCDVSLPHELPTLQDLSGQSLRALDAVVQQMEDMTDSVRSAVAAFRDEQEEAMLGLIGDIEAWTRIIRDLSDKATTSAQDLRRSLKAQSADVKELERMATAAQRLSVTRGSAYLGHARADLVLAQAVQRYTVFRQKRLWQLLSRLERLRPAEAIFGLQSAMDDM
ncbi:hypothetical protein QBC47DRAFT_441649 [Echria macrotheca]|uniref:Ubiquitin-like protease family profile domain-containing protein n=1 Tax=Echria macrotheca TaxID=438768 RepID=A0AAJ0B2C8_9PEZI|nr:hypothetical protein QBC47DRAFT_441649 [Echria macrotheca]